ncbi:MAG TPA: GNAT family N-acetyltransferase [Chitinophagales bacterium]|nr:GNAT family N-acetyltransferase [Chitinophagales bacterium]
MDELTLNDIEVIYREARIADCKDILLLNQRFYKAFLDGEKEKGFLKNQFTLEQIQALVEHHEVVISELQGKLIGYYLVNSIFETDEVRRRKRIVEELIYDGKIENAKYVYLTQAVVDKPFMGKGVAKELLKSLKKLVSNKFEFLIGNIDFENLNAKEAHLRSGWIIFKETEKGWLALTNVK